MGIPGLTTFIANCPSSYFKDYRLHDSYLVVDGNNLAMQLYKFYCHCFDCFGGDYDKYKHKVVSLFNVFKECNVTPLVIFDGGFEKRKLKTHYERILSRINNSAKLCSATEGSIQVFPLLIRYEFRKILAQLGVKMAQCDFEADVELSCIARILDCPVLSYDSDFYVSNVKYIPINKMEFSNAKRNKQCKYIQCQMYCVESFLHEFKLCENVLPLIGVLLGNDYIKVSTFQNVYDQMKMRKRKYMNSPNQKRIYSLLKWLEGETIDSATKKVLSKCKANVRQKMLAEISKAIQGYVITESTMLQYMNVTVSDVKQHANDAINTNVNVDEIESEDDEEKINYTGSYEDGILSDEEKVIFNSIPKWFLDKYRSCEYPAPFMNYIVKNQYFFNPQLEDHKNHYADTISLPIISAIFTVLTSGERSSLKFVVRHLHNQYKIIDVGKSTSKLPKLNELPDFSKELAKHTLLTEVLKIDKSVLLLLQKFPESYQLYLVAIIFWVKNSSPAVNHAHIYALFIAMLQMTCIDKKIGYFRSMKAFKEHFNKNIEKAANGEATVPETVFNFDISAKEALMYMNDAIEMFSMSHRLLKNHKIYDISIVDAYAQFQSAFLHISDLNCLLNKPFQDVLISDFYNGTYIYHICEKLQRRSNLDEFVMFYMKSAPTLYKHFYVVTKLVMQTVTVQLPTNNKRRRRKNKKKSAAIEEKEEADVQEVEQSADNKIIDANNRFSLLQI